MPTLDSLSLTASQRSSLDQLRAITSTGPENTGEDDEVTEQVQNEIAVLESVQWDIEQAANAIFSQPQATQPMASTSASSTTAAAPKPTFERFQVDDSAQGREPRNTRPPTMNFPARIFLSLFSLASFPITLAFSIISHVLRLLRIPIPRMPISFTLSFAGLRNSLARSGMGSAANNRNGRIPDDPFLAADRLVRELEDETGAITVSRARASAAESSGTAGPSITSLPLNPDPTRKLLPDFHLGSYESALQLAKRDARPVCAILLSDEHDDTPPFKRNVLTDPEFVRVLTEGEFIVWIGDIRGSEGYQASLKLTATTYPFVAFIGLQPRLPSRSQGISASSSSTSLTILSRHPSSSTPAPLSASILAAQVTNTIIPRITPLRLQALAREEERRLRDAQDAAFRAAERADGERIMRRRREEEDKRRKAEEEAEELLRLEEAKKLQVKEEERYKNWLSSKFADLGVEPNAGNLIRVGVRLPDGKRVIRKFAANDELENVYVWVGALLYNVADGGSSPKDYSTYKPSEHPFSLAVAFPRKELPCLSGQKVGDVEALQGGAQLVVEGFSSNGNGPEDDDDASASDED
ncbi:hypothetical protein M422DRAFT_239543 [Sphaerobolus stellatus SS14]|nr:hypothetical protein M422DRAFT_239543 [Sphaerobolus stellatus SS14]